MGEKITLDIALRTVHGKKVAQLRKDGIVPGVVYGKDVEPTAVQMDGIALKKVIEQAGYHTPVQMTLNGKKQLTIVKDIEYDHVKRLISHVSFHAINQKTVVTTEVPIILTGEGESEAEKAGLIVLQSLERLEIKALPKDLPESLELSRDGLKAEGDKLTVADITLPEGVELNEVLDASDEDAEANSVRNLVVAAAYEPAALQAANEAAAGDAEDESEVESENGGDDAAEADTESSDKK